MFVSRELDFLCVCIIGALKKKKKGHGAHFGPCLSLFVLHTQLVSVLRTTHHAGRISPFLTISPQVRY